MSAALLVGVALLALVPAAAAQSTVVFDDYTNVNPADVDIFSGNGASISAVATAGHDGSPNSGIQFNINPGPGGSFAGFVSNEMGSSTDVSSTSYFTFYVRTNLNANNVPMTLEVNLQEDANGNGTYEGGTEDEFQTLYQLTVSGQQAYQRVQIPLSSFTDDNSFYPGSNDGFDYTRLHSVVIVFAGINGSAFDIAFDEFVFEADPIAETGAYRSRQSGLSGSATTWQRFSGTTWENATAAPLASGEDITIRTGHIVTVNNPNGNTFVTGTTVEDGATLSIVTPSYVGNRTGLDFDLRGALIVNGTFVLQSTSAASLAVGSTVDVQSGFFAPLADAQVDIYGQVDVQSGATFTARNNAIARVHSGALVDNRGTTDTQDAAALEVEGRLVNRSVVNGSGTSQLIIQDGGVYEHARNGGDIPSAARTTWATGSTTEITGMVNAPAGGFAQSFYNLTWANSGQSVSIAFNGILGTVRGTLTVASSGSGTTSLVSDGATDTVIEGDLIQTGGTLIHAAGTSSATLEVGGSVSILGGTFQQAIGTGSPTLDVAGGIEVAGGTLEMTTGTGSPTVRVAGALEVAGGTLTTASASTVVLDGTSQQDVTLTGTVSGPVGLEVDNAAGVAAQSAFVIPGDVTVTQGTLDMNSLFLTVGGDVLVSGGLVQPGRLIANGAGNQTYDYAGLLEVPRLVVDKSGGTLTLASAELELTGGIVVADGDLDLNGQPVLLKSDGGRTATLFREGAGVTVTGAANVSVERAFGTGGDGWRMLSVPLDGVSYSDLNGTFHTQGAPWATSSAGTANLQRLDAGAQDWVPLSGADAAFAAGTGYIFYMWEDTPDGAPQLPGLWTVTGSPSTLASVPLTYNTAANDSHNLVGNPWVANLDWDATVAASTNVGTSYAVWDAAVTDGGGMSGYQYYNSAGGTGAAGPYIPPLQAFSAQATGVGADLVFASSSAANDGTPVYQGRRSGPSTHVRLHLEGGGLGESETYLVFDPDAETGRDPFDVDRLDPLGESYATLWLASNGSRLAFDGRSMASGQETFDLHLASTTAGTYTLSWPVWHDVPEAWSLVLHDRETGRETDLRSASSMTLRLEASDPANQTGPSRYALVVTDPALVRDASLSPDAVRLAPNVPNPLRTTTDVRFALEDAGPVHLAVYDALGRQVAVLAEGDLEDGWHTARWDASRVASGSYILRLVAGGGVETRVMTVAR